MKEMLECVGGVWGRSTVLANILVANEMDSLAIPRSLRYLGKHVSNF